MAMKRVRKTKLGIEIKPLTFKGRSWRVNLSVTDHRDGVIESWKTKPVTFCVARLPALAHRATAFSTGIQVYYGPDFAVAVNAVEKFIGRLVWPNEFPEDWYRYKHPDSDTFRDKLEELGNAQSAANVGRQL